MTELTIKNIYNKITVETNLDDLNVEEMITLFKSAMIACGYSLDNIKEIEYQGV